MNHNQEGVIEFLDGPFTYYTALYKKILDGFNESSDSALFHNRLNDLDGSFMLLMSSCVIDDTEEEEKLRLIPYELDRLFTLLQLQGAYDSNAYQELLYKISAEIRDKPTDVVREVFDKHIMEEVSKRRSIDVNEPFRYAFFKHAGIGLNARFKRYFFGRVDEFLAKGMNFNMKHPLEELVKSTGAVNGFHVEHILAHNDENHALYDYDEERFEQERNRLGGILLLKGKDNISSNNEMYSEKLKSYANTLYWNETLREDSYKSKLDLTNIIQEYGLDLVCMNEFGPEEVEARQKLLFDLTTIIWK